MRSSRPTLAPHVVRTWGRNVMVFKGVAVAAFRLQLAGLYIPACSNYVKSTTKIIGQSWIRDCYSHSSLNHFYFYW